VDASPDQRIGADRYRCLCAGAPESHDELDCGPAALFVGLAQIILVIVGPVFFVVGLYRIGTKDQTPSRSASRRNWAILIAGVAAIGLYLWATAPGRSILPGTQAESVPQDKWAQISSNGKGDSLHINLGSIKRSGNLVEYWSKIQFAVQEMSGPYKLRSH